MPDKNIFVFGSNLAGRHGKGAALTARTKYGAVSGVGVGPTGNAYAIPTKDAKLEPLPLDTIRIFVGGFIKHARFNWDHTFNVTRVGCGLAGYKDEQIAPMFKYAPSNCRLPDEWKAHLA